MIDLTVACKRLVTVEKPEHTLTHSLRVCVFWESRSVFMLCPLALNQETVEES